MGAEAKKIVEIIPAKSRQELKAKGSFKRLKVASYCRVSTDSDEQANSFEAQKDYFENLVKKNPEWEFAGIYADLAITGTNTKKRVEFNRMIEDCKEGKIDLVITKSISRFARNTVDALANIRMLKDLSIGVFFEKENVNTLDSKGEFLLAVLSSLAQEEAFNISRLTHLGITYRFKSGKVLVNHNRLLGYTKDEKGELIVDTEQAKVIRRIYKQFLEGYSTTKIARLLTEDGIPNGIGSTKWYENTVRSILKNEKFMGDVLQQKTYTVDYLEKKRGKNLGELQKYYIENNHEPIVSKEEFAAVQAEFIRRSEQRGYSKTGKSAYSSAYSFSGKLFCYNCGSKLRRIYYGRGKNKKAYWICINHQNNGNKACSAKSIQEKALEHAFIRAMNKVIGDKENFLKDLKNNITKTIKDDILALSEAEIDAKLKEVKTQVARLIKLSIKGDASIDLYNEQYKALAKEEEELMKRKQDFKGLTDHKAFKGHRMNELVDYLNSQCDLLKAFDEDIFRRLVDKVIVRSMVEAVFVFRNGIELREIVE